MSEADIAAWLAAGNKITRCRTMFAVPSEHACLPVAPANLIIEPPKVKRGGFSHPVTLRKAMAARGATV